MVLRAVKAGTSVIAGGAAYVWAQVQLPDLDAVGSVGLVGLLAVLIARYTLRQLEDYRADLKAARDRITTLEDDLSRLGKAKAATETRNRELEEYAHRLNLWAIAVAGDGPAPPEFPDPRPSPA